VLSVFAGADLHLRELARYGWMALAVVGARSLAALRVVGEGRAESGADASVKGA